MDRWTDGWAGTHLFVDRARVGRWPIARGTRHWIMEPVSTLLATYGGGTAKGSENILWLRSEATYAILLVRVEEERLELVKHRLD